MKWIARQPYYKVEREVDSLQQRNVVSDRFMDLYPDKIVTKHREFPIDHVLDMSYRPMGSTRGILYLHTNKGVYSYMVKEDPAPFIKIFKQNKR